MLQQFIYGKNKIVIILWSTMCLSPADHLSCVAWVATPPWRQWNSHGKLLRNAFIKLGSTFLGSTFFCFIMKVGVDGDSEVSNLHCSPHKWKHGRAGMLRLRLSPMLCLSFSVKAVTLQFYVTVIVREKHTHHYTLLQKSAWSGMYLLKYYGASLNASICIFCI